MIKSAEPADAEQEFERLWPLLLASLEPSGLMCPNGKLWLPHNKASIWERIARGDALLWPGEASVILTETYQSVTGLRSHHNWLAGGELEEIKYMMGAVEQWGRNHGCHRQTGSGRRGWLKEFTGYEEIGVRKQKCLLPPDWNDGDATVPAAA